MWAGRNWWRHGWFWVVEVVEIKNFVGSRGAVARRKLPTLVRWNDILFGWGDSMDGDDTLIIFLRGGCATPTPALGESSPRPRNKDGGLGRGYIARRWDVKVRGEGDRKLETGSHKPHAISLRRRYYSTFVLFREVNL